MIRLLSISAAAVLSLAVIPALYSQERGARSKDDGGPRRTNASARNEQSDDAEKILAWLPSDVNGMSLVNKSEQSGLFIAQYAGGPDQRLTLQIIDEVSRGEEALKATKQKWKAIRSSSDKQQTHQLERVKGGVFVIQADTTADGLIANRFSVKISGGEVTKLVKRIDFASLAAIENKNFGAEDRDVVEDTMYVSILKSILPEKIGNATLNASSVSSSTTSEGIELTADYGQPTTGMIRILDLGDDAKVQKSLSEGWTTFQNQIAEQPKLQPPGGQPAGTWRFVEVGGFPAAIRTKDEALDNQHYVTCAILNRFQINVQGQAEEADLLDTLQSLNIEALSNPTANDAIVTAQKFLADDSEEDHASEKPGNKKKESALEKEAGKVEKAGKQLQGLLNR